MQRLLDLLIFLSLNLLMGHFSYAQNAERPTMAAAPVTEGIQLDGKLDEPDWAKAPANDQFLSVVPEEGGSLPIRLLSRF